MDASLEKIKNAGYPKQKEESFIDKTKSDYIGNKAILIFSCFRCQSTFETAKEYRLSDNYAEHSIKFKTRSVLWDLLYKTLGQIPIIGYRLYQAAGESMDNKIQNATGNKFDDAREEGFKEVKANYILCEKCGEYGCVCCIENGACRICRGIY